MYRNIFQKHSTCFLISFFAKFLQSYRFCFSLSSLVTRLISSFFTKMEPSCMVCCSRICMSRIFNLFSIPFSHWRLNKKFRLYRRRLSRGSCTLCWADCCRWISSSSSLGRWLIRYIEESRPFYWSCLLMETRMQWSNLNWNTARASTIVCGSVSKYIVICKKKYVSGNKLCARIDVIPLRCKYQDWEYFSRLDLRLQRHCSSFRTLSVLRDEKHQNQTDQRF